MTCRSRCLSINGTSLTVGYGNSSLSSVGFGNSTITDVIDGDGLTINGIDVENDDTSDSAGNARKRAWY